MNMPIYIYEKDQEFYEANGSVKVGRSSVEQFVSTNVVYKCFFELKLVQEQVSLQNENRTQYSKRLQRRRRKRNAFGVLEDRLAVV